MSVKKLLKFLVKNENSNKKLLLKIFLLNNIVVKKYTFLCC